ncbi:MAG: class I SAM-dependent methyltransferase [Candidatus Aminicenantes bacterium]|nr:class I SAM-dependent methyltransferase [Candidatus Aminicenantes bacterium]
MDDLKGRKELLKLSGLKRGRILDVGMGECGCMSLYLARRGFEVTGIDTGSWAVHKSRKAVEDKRLKGSFVARRIDAAKMPFEKNSFDAVFSYHSLHHMKDMPKAVDEMFRVCRRGGLVVVSDLHAWGRKEYNHRPDDKFLSRIEKQLRKHAQSIRMDKTQINMMFVCEKK